MKTYNHPGFQIGEPAAGRLAGNIIPAADLALVLSVSLPQLSRLYAKGIAFRHSQGKYFLAESVANYLAYKSAPLARTYDEALADGEAKGFLDPATIARDAVAWVVQPSDDIEAVRRRHHPFDTARQIAEFQRTLRVRRLTRQSGKYVAKHCDIAAGETFQLMRRVGLNDSTHPSFAEHCAAYEATWTSAYDKMSQPKTEALGKRLLLAECAARAVESEEAAQASWRGR